MRALLVIGAPALLALALFLALDPAASWRDWEALLALLAVAAVTFGTQVQFDRSPRDSVRFDASYAVVLVALPIAGPLPTLAIWVVPELVGRLFLRDIPNFSPGLVATLGGFALASLAGFGILELSGGASPAALLGAGLALWIVNFAVAGPLYTAGTENLRRALDLIRQDIPALAPAAIGAIVIGVLTWLAMPALGLWALALTAGAVLLPEIALERLSRSEPAARLPRPGATRLYAQAIADVMGMSRRERRVVALAAARAVPPDGSGPRALGVELATWVEAADSSELVGAEEREARIVALRARDRVDGADWPYGLGALLPVPVASRVLAGASAWSDLTAQGGPELSHREALLRLRDRAGSQLDPAVVGAVARVISREALFLGTGDFQPKLHRLPLPRRVRQSRLPRVLARSAAGAG